MTNHTPAPWGILKSEQSRPESRRVDIVSTLGEFAPSFIAGDALPEDARLIAAAPDLLSALSAIVADYHALQRSQGASASLGADFTAGAWLGSRLGGHIAQAESAIAKAKGEA
jgi:CelD/BcsL family acetyltransferase involved in cellulose biosynthesis